MKIKNIPRKHQLASVEFARNSKGRVAFYHSIGCGKTYTALLSAGAWGCKKVLVVSPTSVINTWESEIAKHTYWKFISLIGTTFERKKLVKKKVDIYIINWEGLKYLFGTKDHNRFLPDSQYIQSSDFDCIIFDECHRLANPQSVQFRIAEKLSAKAAHCIILTGTPISGSEMDLWGQFWVLDQGQTLGRNFYHFRSHYFKPTVHRGRYRNWTDWKIRDGAREEILDKIATITLRYSRSDCHDLPPLTYEKRLVHLSKQQLDLIGALKSEIRSEINPKIARKFTKLGINKAIKLAQIPGGSILSGAGKAVRFDNNPKLEELEAILEQLDEKVIVFHAFVEEGRMIEEMCAKRKWKFASLRAEIKDKKEQINKFINNPGVRIMIAHPYSGGEGLNLQVASVCVFYSNGFTGYQKRKQAEGRVYRDGQEKPCVIIDLISLESLDEHILSINDARMNIMNIILDYLTINDS